MKVKGICFVCACTEEDGCESICSWADKTQTLCSACKPLKLAARYEKRERCLKRLNERLEMLQQEAKSTTERLAVIGSEPIAKA